MGSPAAYAADDATRVLTFRKNSALLTTSWDSSLFWDAQVLWHNVFEGLYGMNEARGGYYNELAKDVKLSDDQLTYTVTLVDATFQNGEPLRASDVVFSYKGAMATSYWNYVTNMIEDVSAVDDHTVAFKLKFPFSPIAHTFFSIKITSEKEVKAAGDSFGTKPHKAGTGPYYINEYDPAAGVKLKAYEGYWRGAPKIKNIDVLFIVDNSAAVIAYENGEIGYLHDAPTTEWEDLEKAAKGRSSMVKGNNIRYLAINPTSKVNNSILANALVRKAICYAINKDMMNKVATNGYGSEAYEFIPSSYCQTSPPASAGEFELYKYNPDKSRELLREAGFTEAQLKEGVYAGKIITYGSATSERVKMAQVAQANLADVGLRCDVEFTDAAIYSPKVAAHDFDIAVAGDSGNFDFNNIRQQVHSESVGMNLVPLKYEGSPFNWQRIEELVTLGASTADVKTRLGYYTELWKIVQDTATIFPLLHMPVGVVWGEGVNPGEICPTYFHFYDFSWAD
jgi:peptide/nickel transport system substrate-binding protein